MAPLVVKKGSNGNFTHLGFQVTVGTQTTGLVQLLRAHNVPFELIVYPDDTHEPLLHKRYLCGFTRMSEFLGRHLKSDSVKTTAGQR